MTRKMLAMLAVAGAATGAAMADPGDVYVWDMRNRDVFFMPTDASSRTFLTQSGGFDSFAMDFDPSATTLHAFDHNAGTFGTIDLTDGSFTATVALGGDAVGAGNPTGLTFAPDGTAYYSTSTTLFSLDINTGNTTTIGDFNSAGLMIDISADVNGNLYGHDISDDALYSIDAATGTATFIGGHGLAANFAQGMDFDWSTNTLYATIYTGGGTGQYGSFDLTDGSFTMIRDTTSWNAEMEMAVRAVPAPGVAALLGMGGLVAAGRRRR